LWTCGQFPAAGKNPQFNKETLPSSLKPSGVKYIHMPEIVGCNAFRLLFSRRNSVFSRES
jgi:hypothetical protein